MSEMSEREKLQVLLAHWIEHNNGHVAECSDWLTRVGDLEEGPAAAISEAISAFNQASEALTKALDLMGGPPEGHHHHHH